MRYSTSYSQAFSFFIIIFVAAGLSGCDTPAGDITSKGSAASQNRTVQENGVDFFYHFLTDDLPGGLSGVSAINNNGEVAGDYRESEYYHYAYGWKPGEDFRRYYDYSLEYSFSVAHDINTQGQLVGHDNYRGRLWKGDKTTELGSFGGDRTIAFAINEQAQIVGYSETPQELKHAFLWQNGNLRDLGSLCHHGGESWASSINEQGQIVGLSETEEGDMNVFLWEDGEMQDLGITRNSGGYVEINDKGQILIAPHLTRSYVGQIDPNAKLWEDGQVTALNFWPIALNNQGQVLGYCEKREYLLWEKGKIMELPSDFDIPDINEEKVHYTAINDVGQLAGVVAGIDSSRIRGGEDCIGPDCHDGSVHYAIRVDLPR